MLDKQFDDIDSMSEDDLRSELQQYRNLWTWLDDEVKYYLLKVGTVTRILTRGYQPYVGMLGMPRFKLSELEMDVDRREYNYSDGKHYMERKTILIPANGLTHIEFIEEQEEIEDVLPGDTPFTDNEDREGSSAWDEILSDA